MNNKKQISLLLALFVVLVSIPYLVPGTGFLSLIAFIPLLRAEAIAFRSGMKRFWLWYFSAFVLWNAATTFWVSNATVGGGIFAVVANALRMTAVFALFRWSRKNLGVYFRDSLPYIFLVVLWISFERFDLTWAKISWPWLVLGNSFARTTDWIQWYEFTGTLGGTLWIWAVNIALFRILDRVAEGEWKPLSKRMKVSSVVVAALLVLVPPVISLCVMPKPAETAVREDAALNVLIAQPNIDPYNKFGGMTQDMQNIELFSLLNKSSKDSSFLMIGPETFASGFFLNDLSATSTFFSMGMFMEQHPKSNLLIGISARKLYESKSRPTPTARLVPNAGWTDSYNSAMLLDGYRHADVCHKSKLVVGVESMPYPKLLRPIDDMLGGVMGRCIGQPKPTTLKYHEYDSAGTALRTVPFGCAICYESVYGEYCTEYVKAGARFLTVITNDAWWGDTPGYRQHLSYAALRAIETRRWVARCANTGLSAIIDPAGRIVKQSTWNKRESIRGTIGLSDEQTFFVRHGDWIGRVSLLLAALLFLALLGAAFSRRRGH